MSKELRLNVRISAQERKEWKRQADKYGLSLASFVRMCIKNEIERKEK